MGVGRSYLIHFDVESTPAGEQQPIQRESLAEAPLPDLLCLVRPACGSSLRRLRERRAETAMAEPVRASQRAIAGGRTLCYTFAYYPSRGMRQRAIRCASHGGMRYVAWSRAYRCLSGKLAAAARARGQAQLLGPTCRARRWRWQAVGPDGMTSVGDGHDGAVLEAVKPHALRLTHAFALGRLVAFVLLVPLRSAVQPHNAPIKQPSWHAAAYVDCGMSDCGHSAAAAVDLAQRRVPKPMAAIASQCNRCNECLRATAAQA
jgi:hypothetical protein